MNEKQYELEILMGGSEMQNTEMGSDIP